MADIFELPLVYYDCHLHLPECPEVESILTFARSEPIELFSVSVGIEESRSNLELGRRYPEKVRVFVGIHPSEAAGDQRLEELELLSEDADGIGEVGLDPKYSSVEEGSLQVRVFTGQLGLAERQGKPVQVHSRGAEKACLDRLNSFHPPRVLLHWFEGEELASQAAGRGYYVSFGPALLYSKKLARIAKEYPRDLVLTESDAPVAYRALGELVAGPYLVPSVVFSLAQLNGVDFEEMEASLSENSRRYLKERRKG